MRILAVYTIHMVSLVACRLALVALSHKLKSPTKNILDSNQDYIHTEYICYKTKIHHCVHLMTNFLQQ